MQAGILFVLAIVLVPVIGYYLLEAMKVRRGYPLTDEDGNQILPRDNEKMAELLDENKALRDQLDTVYDRIETLERIVTDKPSRLAEEIDALAALPPRPKPEKLPTETLTDKDEAR